MFFIVGLDSRQQLLGPGAMRTCPRCHNTTQWARARTFRQLTLFFVPVARWGRRRVETCGVCGASLEA
ncbi:zinc-ribbon domain-containing protein [Citricoccus sp. SGAir0253]|uniref:zinc-ribbon domain-containing protein n=1 Tax=Citricoccus sp. SGAir0253 TaxID=2567881 RepID=UPI0010CCB4B7|nr:zinc-ribbon domain-containing protein [Citricoccus sp. SGAir0253]QCU78760.1 zinc-ribbon domain-containing protein [Citricoccus sp. SGAir0253]